MAYELPSRVVQAAGERTGVRARAIAGRGSMIAHPARSPCSPPRQTSVRHEACPPARRPRDPPRQTSARCEHTSCFLWLLYAPVGNRPPTAAFTQRASLGTPPPDLRATHPARPPCGAPRQTSVRRKHTSCFLWLLYAPVGGGPPARSPHASLTARNDRSRGPPWPCRRPPAPQPHSPAGLAPPSSRATMTTGTAATIPADHTPPTSRAAAHRHRRKLAPQVLSGTKLSLINTSAEATGQNSPCSS